MFNGSGNYFFPNNNFNYNIENPMNYNLLNASRENAEIERINRKHQINLEKLKLKHLQKLEDINKKRNEALFLNKKKL